MTRIEQNEQVISDAVLSTEMWAERGMPPELALFMGTLDATIAAEDRGEIPMRRMLDPECIEELSFVSVTTAKVMGRDTQKEGDT